MREDCRKKYIDTLFELRQKNIKDYKLFDLITELINYVLDSVKLDKDALKKLFEVYDVDEENNKVNDYAKGLIIETIDQFKPKRLGIKSKFVVNVAKPEELDDETIAEVVYDMFYQNLKAFFDDPQLVEKLDKMREHTDEPIEVFNENIVKTRKVRDVEALDHMRALKKFCETQDDCDKCPFHAKDRFDGACIIGSPNCWTKEHALSEASEARWRMNEALDEYYRGGGRM